MMMDAISSHAVGDFLKCVYRLQQQSERVSTNNLADALAISPPSVTDMAQRLTTSGLLDYRKYYGVRLTPEGEEIAIKLIRRHRLIELYLAEELDYGPHEVHTEADALEHVVSDRFVEAVFTKLGSPTHDPHGDPIPTAEGVITRRDLTPLSDVAAGETAFIRRYDTQDDSLLAHILERGLYIGAQVTVDSHDPFDGPVTLTVNDDTAGVMIGRNVAVRVLVGFSDE